MSTTTHALYFVHALTPLHVGTDQGIGAIDLPTMREAHTGWPILPGSSVKGVIREQAEICRGREDQAVLGVFGPPIERAGDHRGGVVFGDAWPLLLPVRSLAGTFAWVTCSQALRRLVREGDEASLGDLVIPRAPGLLGTIQLPSTQDAASAIRVGKTCVLLDDLALRAEEDLAVGLLAGKLARWIWPEDAAAIGFLAARIAVVHDDVFGHFCRHGMELRARVSISHETGTVAQGPWTEEHIPAETVLCGLLRGRGTVVRRRKNTPDPDDGRDVDENALHEDATVSAPDALDQVREILDSAGTLRFGGNASIGLGRARISLKSTPPMAPPPSVRGTDPNSASPSRSHVSEQQRKKTKKRRKKGGRR